MNLDPYVNTIGQRWRERFGERVRKLSLNAGFSCPNRDGTLGRGGCTFCSVLSFAADGGETPLAEQLAARRGELKRAARYVAYFQAYTNTYAEVETLTRLYAEATASPDVVGLAVGTRPDCVPDAVLALLAGYRERGYEVWLELGLQSADDATLARVNRGHGWAAYADAVARARRHGVPVCTHLIVGLPGETGADAQATLQRVLDAGVEGLKLHPLMIVRGSRMAVAHRRGELQPPTLEDYAATAAGLIRHTPREVVFHRVSATARPPTLVAPDWCSRPWPAIQAIGADLERHGGQGSRVGQRPGAAGEHAPAAAAPA